MLSRVNCGQHYVVCVYESCVIIPRHEGPPLVSSSEGCWRRSSLTPMMKSWRTDVWQHKLSVTSWTYGAFLSVLLHGCHPSRCQRPACCHEWLMVLAGPIFCLALMSLVPRLLELILKLWNYSVAQSVLQTTVHTVAPAFGCSNLSQAYLTKAYPNGRFTLVPYFY